MKQKTKNKLPNARWIRSRKDLPDTRDEADYFVLDGDGKSKTVTLSKRLRQVLEALLCGPIRCASPVRLSDAVLILRRDYGLNIETDFHTDGEGDEAVTFGVYTLVDDVSLDTSDEAEVAA